MNRTRHDSNSQIPGSLAKASSLSERAARAMCANGSNYPLARLQASNVITLRNQTSLFPGGSRAGEGACGTGKALVDEQNGVDRKIDGEIDNAC